MSEPSQEPQTESKSRLLRLSPGDRYLSRDIGMRWLFSTSATFTIIVLGLIIFFLLKESAGFFRQYNDGIVEYRTSGLEYTDILRERYREHVEINHRLVRIRADWIDLLRERGLSEDELSRELRRAGIGQLFAKHRAAGHEMRAFIDQKIALAIKERDRIVRDRIVGTSNQAESRLEALREGLSEYKLILESYAANTQQLFNKADSFDFGNRKLERRLDDLAAQSRQADLGINTHLAKLSDWDNQKPIAPTASIFAFLTGEQWVTASEQQNWFGLIPLLSGSLLICSIALVISIPFGVGAAVYVNQIAGPREQAWIKPFIEFISALPAVVVGFFGVMIFGEFIREVSRLEALEWLPFFPIQERLNVFTAGSLLGLMAVPTIFTLTEEALNNVPRHLKEASYAIGATKLQTTWRTIIPSALPGIISAIMLGFGRVIGETMVVLLCAGNRVKIPEFSEGLKVAFEPVHTMTGMIAQEMGEVVYGSLHYRALFMLGIVLFAISLVVNYTAQTMAQRHSNQKGYRR